MRAPYVIILAAAGCASPVVQPIATPIPVTSARAIEPEPPTPSAVVAEPTPEPPPPKVVVVSTSNPPAVERLSFAPSSSVVGEQAVALLDAIADTMKAHPEIELLQVEGHADPKEKDPAALSHRRAEAVVAALVSRGVDPGRLRAKGFGALCPIAGAGLERRVDFKIAKRSGVAEASALGCPAATAAGVTADPIP